MRKKGVYYFRIRRIVVLCSRLNPKKNTWRFSYTTIVKNSSFAGRSNRVCKTLNSIGTSVINKIAVYAMTIPYTYTDQQIGSDYLALIRVSAQQKGYSCCQTTHQRSLNLSNWWPEQKANSFLLLARRLFRTPVWPILHTPATENASPLCFKLHSPPP